MHRFSALFFFMTILFVTPGITQGQTLTLAKNYTYSIGGSFSKGFIVAHDPKMRHLAVTHPEGFSLWFKKHTFGQRDWEKALKYPAIGIVFDYFDYNGDMLGHSIAATGFLDYYLARTNNSAFIFQFGVGLSYSSSPYDKRDNNKNIAIGSPITYSLRAQIAYNREIYERLKFISALRLTHYSNGALALPNKGINIPTVDLGLSYALNKDKPAYQLFNTTPQIDGDLQFEIFIGSGLKEVTIDGKKFPFVTASFYTSKQTSMLNSFNLGVDYFHSWATKEEIAIDRDLESRDLDFRRIGLVGGHELLIGKLSFLTQLGVYVYRPYKSDKPIYQRYGLKYALSEKFYGGVFLKSHYGKAEAVEWGIGIKL